VWERHGETSEKGFTAAKKGRKRPLLDRENPGGGGLERVSRGTHIRKPTSSAEKGFPLPTTKESPHAIKLRNRGFKGKTECTYPTEKKSNLDVKTSVIHG